jgi:hypothetical protein
MNVFCFLWIPLFYLFWRAIARINPAGGAWAFIGGIITALVQFFGSPLVEGGGFGFSRWLSGCVDIVVLPALTPLFVYLILVIFKVIQGSPDFANFAFLWLLPCAAARAMGWISLSDPVHLILVPILWSAIAAGIPFFINLIVRFGKILVIIPSSIAIIIIPLAAANSYWAFFSQNFSKGRLYLVIAVIPMLASVILANFHSPE